MLDVLIQYTYYKSSLNMKGLFLPEGAARVRCVRRALDVDDVDGASEEGLEHGGSGGGGGTELKVAAPAVRSSAFFSSNT